MMWNHLLSETCETVLVSRNECVDQNRTSSFMLDLCLNLVSNKGFEDVIWIRNTSPKGKDLVELLEPSDISMFSSQAKATSEENSDKKVDLEFAFRKVKIKYLNNYNELRKYILNYHLLLPNVSFALVIDDVEKFCGSQLSDNYLEISALALDMLHSLSPNNHYFLGFSISFPGSEISTTKLGNYFQERVEIFEDRYKKLFLLRKISHSLNDKEKQQKKCEIQVSPSIGKSILFNQPILCYTII
jgi:hypothetical protein